MQGPFEIYPYRREKDVAQGESASRQKLFRRILWFTRQWSHPKGIALIAVAFLLGRAVIAGQIAPFGLALIVAVLGRYRPFVLPVIVSVLVGEATIGTGTGLWPNLFTYFSLMVVLPMILQKHVRPVQLGIVTGVWALAVKSGFVVLAGHPVAYDYVMIAVEAVVAGTLVPLLVPLVNLFRQPGRGFASFQEEPFSILVLALALILGLNFQVAEYNIGITVGKYLILLAALGGAGLGAVFGVACGLVSGLAEFNGLVLAGLYAVSGMLAGFLRTWGKPGMLIGFFCGNLLYGFYFSDEQVLLEFLASSSVAGLLLVLTPKAFLNYLVEHWFQDSYAKNDLPGYIKDKLGGILKLLEQLSSGYAQGAGTDNQEQSRERWLRGLVNQVCYDCSFARFCWDEKEAPLSFRYLLRWLNTLERGGQDDPLAVMPVELKQRCSRSEELGASLVYINAVARANRKWQTRINQERKAVAAQLEGVARALAAAQEEWQQNSVGRHPELESAVQQEMEELGIVPVRVEVWTGKGSGLEAYLELPPCQVRQSACLEKISAGLSNGLKVPVILKEHRCPAKDSQGNCYFKYLTMAENSPEFGIAQWPKEGCSVSGDSVIATALDEHRWLFVLSDGMGSGEAANRESSRVVSLLEQFLQLDFSVSDSVEMVNGLLLLKEEERFATVDMAVLDLSAKTLEVVKIGAVPSVLINQGDCQVIESNHPPVGILENITAETVFTKLKPGSVIIMSSDGVWQGPAGENKEGWLGEFVQGLWQVNARELARLIIEHSIILHGGKAEDDLSVIVIRVDG